MNELPLQGRRALVTGSVQGIGLAIAQALAIPVDGGGPRSNGAPSSRA